jgi:hypothetical protein
MTAPLSLTMISFGVPLGAHRLRQKAMPSAVPHANRPRLSTRANVAGDFAASCDLVFPGDERMSINTRRSGVVEAIAGGADAVSPKLANLIGRSNELQDLRASRSRGGTEHG